MALFRSKKLEKYKEAEEWGRISEGILDKTKESNGWERERELFYNLMKDKKIKNKYEDQFIAVYNDEIIDHDVNEISLVKRVYSKFGYKEIYFGKVGNDEEIEVPSPEVG